MKKITVEKRREIEALTNDALPKSAWTVALVGKVQDYNASLNGLLKLRKGILDNPELFDGKIPRDYISLAEKFIAIMNILYTAFGNGHSSNSGSSSIEETSSSEESSQDSSLNESTESENDAEQPSDEAEGE